MTCISGHLFIIGLFVLSLNLDPNSIYRGTTSWLSHLNVIHIQWNPPLTTYENPAKLCWFLLNRNVSNYLFNQENSLVPLDVPAFEVQGGGKPGWQWNVHSTRVNCVKWKLDICQPPKLLSDKCHELLLGEVKRNLHRHRSHEVFIEVPHWITCNNTLNSRLMIFHFKGPCHAVL